MRILNLAAALLAVSAFSFAVAQCPVFPLVGTYDLGPGNDGNQTTEVTPTGPFHLTATNSTFSYVDFTPSIQNNPGVPFTFAQLVSLFANFHSNSGGSGGGTPRISVHLADSTNTVRSLLIYLGNSPNFTDSDAVLNTYSGFNVIGNNDPGRYDTSHFPGGSPFTTYSNALAMVGNQTVVEIDYVVDTFGAFPSRDETLFSIGGSVSTCAAPILTGAAASEEGSFQVRTFANLGAGDSVINIGNTGSSAAGVGAFGSILGGNLCVNVYVFSPDEQEIACCTCLVTPNGVSTVSARQLVSKTLTPAVPTAITVKLIASAGGTGGTACSAVTPGALASGLIAFGTNIHAAPVGGSIASGTFAVTEAPFIPSTLSAPELTRVTTLCGFIGANGSGFGICPGCTTGAAGAVRQ